MRDFLGLLAEVVPPSAPRCATALAVLCLGRIWFFCANDLVMLDRKRAALFWGPLEPDCRFGPLAGGWYKSLEMGLQTGRLVCKLMYVFFVSVSSFKLSLFVCWFFESSEEIEVL